MPMSHVWAFELGRVMLRLRGLSPLLVLAALACSGADERAPVSRSSGLRTAAAEEWTVPCSEGEVRECSVVIKQRAGVTTCAPGVQICEGGGFGQCEIEGPSSSDGAAGAPFEE